MHLMRLHHQAIVPAESRQIPSRISVAAPSRRVTGASVRDHRAAWRRLAQIGSVTTLLATALCAATLAAATLSAQEPPARRLANVVSVAVEEYGKAVDAQGRLVSQLEYGEAVDFLADARGVAARLGGARAPTVRVVLDSLVHAVARRTPPAVVTGLHARFSDALGPEGALELPTAALDLAAGRRLYERNCASCHGVGGLGDGPQARVGSVAAPAVGSAEAMYDVSPATMFRIVSVGIAGTPMPAWAASLSATDRWNVVAYLTQLRGTDAARESGQGLYVQRCASCHGPAGQSDGPYARILATLPPEIGTFIWQAERSDSALAAVIREGTPGRAMPPSRDLADDDILRIVAHLRQTAAATHRPDPATASGDPITRGRAAARRVLTLLDAALTEARNGRPGEAGDRAFDAYIAFEPLETAARAKDAGLVAAMERRFADFKGAVRTGDLRTASRMRDAIESRLPDVVDLMRPPASGWSAFLQSFLIILREGFEAILVIGAVVTLLVKTGHRERLRAVWVGVGLALVASAATAVVLATVLRALPASREVLEGATMLVAVLVLFSISYWLISRAEAARWQHFIRGKVDAALAHGGGRALAVVAFLAVYREGAETALFYQALFHDGRSVMVPLALGVVVGACALAVIFVLFYRYGVRVPLRPFFGVTGTMLYAMAFVFMGRGIRELQEGNVLPLHVIPGFPTVEWLGLYGSWEGLVGQLVLLLLAALALVVTFWPKRSVVLPVLAPPAERSAPPGDPPVGGAAREERTEDARLRALEQAVAVLQQRLAAPHARDGSVSR